MSTIDKFAELEQGVARDLPDVWDKMVSDSCPVITRTVCNSSVGIAVGLIDGIIATVNVLCTMNLSSPEIQEALKDLAQQHNLISLMSSHQEIPGGLIRGPNETTGIRLTDEWWEQQRQRTLKKA